MGQYDTDWGITVRSRSAIQGNSDFINKIEAEDLTRDMRLFSTKLKMIGKLFISQTIEQLVANSSYIKSIMQVFGMVLFESNKDCEKYLKTTHNFMQRQEYIINIATLHPCLTS